MTTPLLKTKLYTPPVRPELVPRPRLIERLGAGLHRKLTLVSASAGFGKTTLVIQWLSGTGRPFAWLSLDEADNDLARFLPYLTAALQGIDASIGQGAQGLLASSTVPAVELAMTSLINGIAGATEPFVLVLDDYHHIHAQPIHEAVEFLITHQPSQLHLVIVTRTDPPLPLPRLRVRGQVTEIRTEDLRFTTGEAVTFLNQALGSTLDAEAVAALEVRTEGWIAGLQLASLALQNPRAREGKTTDAVTRFIAAFNGSHQHVIDYLADEVLAQQPAEIRHFLCQTAILDRLTAPLCGEVTGRDDSEALLRQLEQANLFLVSLDDRREWYRYHALFADFLRTELDPAAQGALHLRAARWFTAHRLLPEAVGHALASGDMQVAAGVIALAAEEALRGAAIATLSGWLDALPDASVRANAELATFKGLVLFLTDRTAEAADYADAAEQSTPADASPSSRGRLLALKAHLALCYDAPAAAVQLARQALDCFGDGDAVFRDLTHNTLGQALEIEGDVAAASEAYGEAFAFRRKAGNQLGTVVVLTNLVFALNELGRRRQALALCQQIIGEAVPQPSQGFSLAEGAYLAWSLISLEANELSLAREQALRALTLCQQVCIADGELWAQFILARVHLASGELDAMRQLCRQARRLGASKQGIHEAWFAALEAQADLEQDDLGSALHWAEAAGLSPSDAPHHWDEFPHFVYVRLLLAQRRFGDAQTLLSTMEHSAQQGGRDRKLLTIFLQQALVQCALGRDHEALAHVQAALQLAVPQGYRRAFLDEGLVIIDLLSRLRHVAPKFVDSLLEVCPIDPARAREAVDSLAALVEPLTEREQQILRLIAAGRSNPEIADLLYLSLNTVKWHAKNLYGKLNVSSRVEAVTRAQELYLL